MLSATSAILTDKVMSASTKSRLAGRQPSCSRRGAPGETKAPARNLRDLAPRTGAGQARTPPGVPRTLEASVSATVLTPSPVSTESPVLTATAGPLAVLGGDVEVATDRGHAVRYANFDIAASAPCLTAAADAVNQLLPYYASVHRGAGALSRRCTLAYERA